MTYIQRLIENLAIVVCIVTMMTVQVYHLNPFVHLDQNYKNINSHMNHIIPQYIMTYNTSDKCIISNWSSKTLDQNNLKYHVYKI